MKKSSKPRGPVPETVVSGQLTLRVPLSLLERLRDAARAEGISIGSLVRQTLGIYFASQTSRTTKP